MPTSFEVDYPNDHPTLWIERQILEAKSLVEGAQPVIKRLGNNAETTNIPGKPQRRRQREPHEGPCNAASMILPVNRKLAKQDGR